MPSRTPPESRSWRSRTRTALERAQRGAVLGRGIGHAQRQRTGFGVVGFDVVVAVGQQQLPRRRAHRARARARGPGSGSTRGTRRAHAKVRRRCRQVRVGTRPAIVRVSGSYSAPRSGGRTSPPASSRRARSVRSDALYARATAWISSATRRAPFGTPSNDRAARLHPGFSTSADDPARLRTPRSRHDKSSGVPPRPCTRTKRCVGPAAAIRSSSEDAVPSDEGLDDDPSQDAAPMPSSRRFSPSPTPRAPASSAETTTRADPIPVLGTASRNLPRCSRRLAPRRSSAPDEASDARSCVPTRLSMPRASVPEPRRFVVATFRKPNANRGPRSRTRTRSRRCARVTWPWP